jgi:hypothetical protein
MILCLDVGNSQIYGGVFIPYAAHALNTLTLSPLYWKQALRLVSRSSIKTRWKLALIE